MLQSRLRLCARRVLALELFQLLQEPIALLYEFRGTRLQSLELLRQSIDALVGGGQLAHHLVAVLLKLRALEIGALEPLQLVRRSVELVLHSTQLALELQYLLLTLHLALLRLSHLRCHVLRLALSTLVLLHQCVVLLSQLLHLLPRFFLHALQLALELGGRVLRRQDRCRLRAQRLLELGLSRTQFSLQGIQFILFQTQFIRFRFQFTLQTNHLVFNRSNLHRIRFTHVLLNAI